MTMNTRLHVAKPVNPETLFLGILDILASDPRFIPAWERPDDEPFKVSPGRLARGRATYEHATKGDGKTYADGRPWCHATTGEQFIEEDSEYRSTLGQGLSALVEVTYAVDGPLVWCEPDEWTSPDEDLTSPTFAPHLVSANFDTSYGFKLPNGAGCADLHAFLLRAIGEHLTNVGAEDWTWHHEERGTWHEPHEWAVRGDADLAAANFGVTHIGGPTDG